MTPDFDLWARELAQPTETPMPPRRFSVTITLGWVIILVLTALVFIGAWVVGSHIIQWVTG